MDVVAQAALAVGPAVDVVAQVALVVALVVDVVVAAADASHNVPQMGHERPGAATKASYRSNVIGPLPVGR